MKETAATEKEKLMNPRKEDTRAISGPTVNSVNLESLEQAIEHMPLGLDDSKESRLLTDDNDRDADAVCGDDVCGKIRSRTVKRWLFIVSSSMKRSFWAFGMFLNYLSWKRRRRGGRMLRCSM